MDDFSKSRLEIVRDVMHTGTPFECIHEVLASADEVIDWVLSGEDDDDEGSGAPTSPTPLTGSAKPLPESSTVH